MKKKIVITGGSGRFGRVLKTFKTNHQLIFPNKQELNILYEKKIINYLKKKKPSIVIHLAGLSRPMNVHERNIELSINLNIVGTANITKACEKLNIKLIYFSTNYVYPGIREITKKIDPILQLIIMLGLNLAVKHLFNFTRNSLILRVCMTEKPFVHKKGFTNVKTSFIYQQDVPKILLSFLIKRNYKSWW